MESKKESTKLEIIWGANLLVGGFTSIPNLLVRNYRVLGIEHGEFGLIINLLSYKHDQKDPFPSQETLATNLKCTTRLIRKWIKSLVDKEFIKTIKVKNPQTKKDRTLYNFQPLISRLLKLTTEGNSPDVQSPSVSSQSDKQENNGGPDIPMDGGPQVPEDEEPKVPTKSPTVKDFDKRIDDTHTRVKINHLIWDRYKENISTEQFAVILLRVSNQPPEDIHDYESYLVTSVENEIEKNKRKSTRLVKKRQPKVSQPKNNQKSSYQRPIIPIVADQPGEEVEVDAAQLEELLQLAARMQAGKTRNSFGVGV